MVVIETQALGRLGQGTARLCMTLNYGILPYIFVELGMNVNNWCWSRWISRIGPAHTWDALHNAINFVNVFTNAVNKFLVALFYPFHIFSFESVEACQITLIISCVDMLNSFEDVIACFSRVLVVLGRDWRLSKAIGLWLGLLWLR